MTTTTPVVIKAFLVEAVERNHFFCRNKVDIFFCLPLASLHIIANKCSGSGCSINRVIIIRSKCSSTTASIWSLISSSGISLSFVITTFSNNNYLRYAMHACKLLSMVRWTDKNYFTSNTKAHFFTSASCLCSLFCLLIIFLKMCTTSPRFPFFDFLFW